MSRRNRACWMCRTRMLRGYYSDFMSATSRAHVGLVEFRERRDTRTSGKHYIAADRRSTNQVNAWQAERESRQTRATSS